MKTLPRIPNTTDIVKLKSFVRQLPEFDSYFEIMKEMYPGLRAMENKQSITLEDFLIAHYCIFEPVSQAFKTGMTKEGEVANVLFNSTTFGLVALHELSPRMALFYIDLVCDPAKAADIKFGDVIMVTLLLLKTLSRLHWLFSSTITCIMSQTPHYSDMPEPDNDTFEKVNHFRKAMVKSLTPPAAFA